MTRRERHERIINWFDSRRRDWELPRLLQRRGLAAFTDEFVEEFAAELVKSYRRSQEMNRRNREIAKRRA